MLNSGSSAHRSFIHRWRCIVKKRAAHSTGGISKSVSYKHKLYSPVAIGTMPVCPRDKPSLSRGQTQVLSLFYTVETQFIPGTNAACPWDKPGAKGGRQSLRVKSLCALRAFCSLKRAFWQISRYRRGLWQILMRGLWQDRRGGAVSKLQTPKFVQPQIKHTQICTFTAGQ